MLFAVALVPLLGACGGDPLPPTLVAFVGSLVNGTVPAGGSYEPIATADVFVVGSNGALLGKAVTDSGGGFVVGDLQKNKPVRMIFQHPTDYARSVFTGETENNDMYLFVGAVYELKISDLAQTISDYTTAAGATAQLMTFSYTTSGNGALVRGRVVRLVQTGNGFAYYNVPGATVQVTDGAGKSYRVFYRGDYPASGGGPGPIDPNRTDTGGDARFAAFGVAVTGTTSDALGFPMGPVHVTVTTTGGTFTFTQDTLVVEDGVTALDLFTVP